MTVFLAGAVNLGDSEVSSSGQLASAALPIFGKLPVLGGILEKHAKDAGASLDGTTPTTPTTTGPDGGPVAVGPDGGVAALGPDGGVAVAALGPDGGVLAGAAGGLSPRAGGRTIGALAAVGTTTEGNLVGFVWQVQFGGAHTTAVYDLAAFADKGAPTRAIASVDGHFATVLSGQHVVTVSPKTGKSELQAALSRGGSIGGLEVQQVGDIAIGPGGALLVVIDGFDAKQSAVVQALVAKPQTGAAFVVRRAGDLVDAAAPVDTDGKPQDRLHGFIIKDGDGSGAVVVEEIIREDDADVGTIMTGTDWTMNPRRLMVGQVDAPRALTEIARSGESVSGIEGVSLEAFGDATALPDGRVVFDANFDEDGPRGWLFQARRAGATFAVAPTLVGKPEAPFSDRAPRATHLSVEPQGRLSFINKDGAVVVAKLETLGDTQVVLLRAEAVKADGNALGGVARVDAARLLPGGEWLLASATVLADGGNRLRVATLSSTADLQAGKTEILVAEGAAVHVSKDPAAPDATLKSLFVMDGHTELLWGTP